VIRLLDILSGTEDVNQTLFVERGESDILITHPSEINTAKQDGFYVDIDANGHPIVPSEVLGADDVRFAMELAKRALKVCTESCARRRPVWQDQTACRLTSNRT
jgi:AbiV